MGTTVGFVGIAIGFVGIAIGFVGIAIGSIGIAVGSVGTAVDSVGTTVGSVGTAIGICVVAVDDDLERVQGIIKMVEILHHHLHCLCVVVPYIECGDIARLLAADPRVSGDERGIEGGERGAHFRRGQAATFCRKVGRTETHNGLVHEVLLCMARNGEV